MFKVPLSAENRALAGVQAGDGVEVHVAVDTEPREAAVPADLTAALDAEPALRAAFDRLTYSQKKGFAGSVESAKTDATRQRRVEKVLDALREGRTR